MVNSFVKCTLFSLLLFWAAIASAAVNVAPVDSVLVFKKMPADTVVAPRKEVVKTAKRTRSSASKSGAVKKKTKGAKLPAEKKKSDSVVYAEKKIYLGDRIIMRGDSGADVKKLAEIMVKNLFIDEKDVPYTKSGAVLYDGELVRAVRLFQRSSGLYGDGIVGETTIKELRKIHRWRRSSN